MTVLAAHRWPTNGHLIEAVAQLGYLRREWPTLDCTFGEGVFWKQWQPDRLTRTDLDPAKSPDHPAGLDFRRLPFITGAFDAVVLDPPYKLQGTPASGDMDTRYGTTAAATWQDRHQLIRDGITECARVTSRVLLLKCQAQVCSGAIRWQDLEFAAHAATVGLDLVDRFDLLGTSRPQPEGRRQVHAHGRPSTLLVFRKAA